MKDTHINLRIDSDTDNKVDKLAKANKIKRSEQYRRIIHSYFNFLTLSR